jgi:nucleoside-specific outer membrane channel protein Tsx
MAATVVALTASGTSTGAVRSQTTSEIGTQLAELKGSDTVAADTFGSSVAISGATAVVGAEGHDKNAGRAYVFTEAGGVWKQTTELKGSDTVANDGFGDSVAISGTTALVGAYGHADTAGRAYVFTEAAGIWKQVAELRGSDTVAHDSFGISVAISGATAVIGAGGRASFAGRAYVFTETAGVWKQTAKLKAFDTVANDGFGDSVAISSTIAIVGASGHASSAGRAYVFTKTAGVWKQTAELKGSDTVTRDGFGDSVAISGSTGIVGAAGHASFAGAAYVFTKTAGLWKQTAKLTGSDTGANDGFGDSVAISDTTAVVGAGGHASSAGTAYVFTEKAGVWKQTAELKGYDTVTQDGFGGSVATLGTIAVVGATGHVKKAGRTYVFEA